MVLLWQSLCLLLFGTFLPSFSLASLAFENTAIVRTVELGGSLVHVSTTFAVRALEAGQKVYHIAITKEEKEKTSWMEAKVKGQAKPLTMTDLGENAGGTTHLMAVALPRTLATDSTINLVLETVQTHSTRPYPAQAAQTDPQLLKYETGLLIVSPYNTLLQRTKFKSLSPHILSYSTPDGVDNFVRGDIVTKTGSTITYGPYHNIQSSSNAEFISKHQQAIYVHYAFDHPVLEVKRLERSAEISHWGANLNIEDKIYLYNAGPALKGHFSRLEHQGQNFFRRVPSHILTQLTLHLPPGVTNAYYYDLNGNVSTSNLRVAPSVPKTSKTFQHSILELRPRYPLLGGWNYSFTYGFDTPLQDSASLDAVNDRHIVPVPVMMLIPGAVVNEASVKIILPEGAVDVEFISPFQPVSHEISTHITYLDTVGRPAVVLTYKNLTDKHIGMIYVSYKVPFSAHLQKPLVVGAAFFAIFMLSLAANRVDLRLHKR